MFGHSTQKDATVGFDYDSVGGYKVFTFKETIKQGEHTVVVLTAPGFCVHAVFGRAAWLDWEGEVSQEFVSEVVAFCLFWLPLS